MVHGLWSIVLGQRAESGSGVSPLNEQSRDGSAAMLTGATKAYEKQMRERTIRAVRNLIKMHGINELELETTFSKKFKL